MPVYSYKTKQGKMYYIKMCINGKQVIKRGFVEKKEAMLFEAKALNTPTHKKKKEVDVYCKELTSSFISFLYKKYKEASAYRYAGMFNLYVLPFFKDYKVTAITNFTIEQFNNFINDLKYSSKKNLIFIAKVYLNFLIKYNLDSSINPGLLYIYKREFIEPKQFDYYTIEEFSLFIGSIADSRYKLLFTLLFDYGLRIGELRGIKHSDIDLTNKKLFIKRAINNKTGSKGQKITSVKTQSSIRDYPLLPSIEKLYIEFLNEEKTKKEGFLFKSRKFPKKVEGETQIKRKQIEYCNKVNLRVIKLHEFRHSCATYLFNQGASLELVAAWLGHADQSITARVYAHLLPSRKLELVKYFDDS